MTQSTGKRVNELLSLARKQNFKVTQRASGHYFLSGPDGQTATISPQPPEGTGIRNVEATLRRIGVDLGDRNHKSTTSTSQDPVSKDEKHCDFCDLFILNDYWSIHQKLCPGNIGKSTRTQQILYAMGTNPTERWTAESLARVIPPHKKTLDYFYKQSDHDRIRDFPTHIYSIYRTLLYMTGKEQVLNPQSKQYQLPTLSSQENNQEQTTQSETTEEEIITYEPSSTVMTRPTSGKIQTSSLMEVVAIKSDSSRLILMDENGNYWMAHPW